jgi:hypothetical protein
VLTRLLAVLLGLFSWDQDDRRDVDDLLLGP